mgnify:CR=1 FL=1|tara:strand:+ start:2914 stop:5358 length:2445 start_codon:yes stop_codon:yes gene_type:complete
MIKQIEKYLKLVSEEINSYLINEFDIREDKFRNYSTFDFINFYLISKYILDDGEKHDLFINLPKDGFRDNLFNSIFQSLVFIKLFQNYFSYEKKIPELNKGDLIYCKFQNKKRVCEIKSVNSAHTMINLKFPGKNEYINNFNLSGRNYTKINPNLSNGRNTAKNINDYSHFLAESFGEKFPFITDFKNRTLVIAEKQFFNESKHLPIRYTNANGRIKNDLPFFNYMIECCSNFETAQNFLLNQNQTFDETIIIGDAKYRERIISILQAKNSNRFKNIIIIGTQYPYQENEFLEWWWSNDEVKIANDELPNKTQKVCLQNNTLFSLFLDLKEEIQKINDESTVNLSYILKYTNFFLRMILVNTNLSKGIYEEYLDRLTHYFQSGAFSEELNTLFYEKDIYNPDTIKGYTDRIFNFFSKISNALETENFKWNYIKQKAKEINTKPIYLLVEKKNFDALSAQIKNEKINNIRLISDKRIDNSQFYLDKWLNDNINSQNKLVIVPYLNNMELYTKIKAIKGNCEILCYEDLDEISFDNVEQVYQNQEKSKLNHKDRLIFFKTDFSHPTEIKKRELDDIFSFNLHNENFRNNPYEALDLPKESAIYEVQFNDGTIDKFDSTKGVFLLEKDEQIKTTVGELYSNATIRFYQNNNKEEFRKILKIFDTENLLDSFDRYSDSWKQTLKDLTIQFESAEKLYDSLFASYKIHINTFRNYLDENCVTRFPRVKTMEVIRDFCLENNRVNDLIVLEFDKFKMYSKKDHSIRQQAGKILGSDLLDYLTSKKEEKSEALNKLPNEILEKLTATIREKTITKKTLVYE